MARTVEDIKKEMIDNYFGNEVVRKAYGIANGETCAKIGVTGVLFYAVAFGIWVLEKFVERERSEIEDIVNTKMYGTIGWWHGKVLAWQDGDKTVVKDGTVGYEVVDEGKRLVKHVAVKAKDRQINIKVAKEVAGVLERLEASELGRLTAYVEEVKPAGLVANVDSYNADEVKISVNIYYDAEVSADSVRGGVTVCLDKYFKKLPFDGTMYKSKIVDALQMAANVRDVELEEIVVGGSVMVGRSYSPVSGYYKYELVANLIEDDKV